VVSIEVTTQDADGNELTAETFLSLFTKSNDTWWNGQTHAEQSHWIFRGHSNANWNAVPRVFRDQKFGIEELVEYFRKHLDEQIKKATHLSGNQMEYALRTHSYTQAFYDFMSASKKIGLLSQVELFHGFPAEKRNAGLNNDLDFICFTGEPNPETAGVRELREGFELAQHFGLPTHLLDWTSNPLVAVHFATSGFSKVADIRDISVYALQIPGSSINTAQEFEGRRVDKPLRFIVYPASFGGNPYAQKQSSYFTVFDKINAKEYWCQYGQYPDVEGFCSLDQPTGLPLLRKYILRKEHVAKLRNYLDRMDVTGYSLLPSFTSVVDSISRTWSVRNSLLGEEP
jgi:FRG domain